MSQAETEEVVEVAQQEAPEPEVVTAADETAAPAEGSGAPESDEVTVLIGGEAPPHEEEDDLHGKPAPEWVKELRKSDREKARIIRELKSEIASRVQAPAETAAADDPMPTIQDCEYDTEKHAAKVAEWVGRTQKRRAEAETRAAAEKQAQAAWNARLATYGEAKAKLKVPDYDAAEARALEGLSQVQQGVVLQGAKSPELIVYALGKNPKKLAELAAIQDPVQFAFAVAELQMKLTVAPRRVAPPPEKVVSGGAAVTGSAVAQLEKLQAEAERTGDRSKVIAFNRQQRNRTK